MEYPLNPEKVIPALEAESCTKMSPELKELWTCLVTLLNDAYECGRCGKTYSADWVKKWSTYFGSKPDPETKHMLELIDSIMNYAYKEGRQIFVATVPVRLQKAGVSA